jgi:DNA repair protein RecO (recombination protein O)
MTYKDEILVLRSFDCKEYDRLYEVFSKNFGKKTIIAKGVRKPKAKLAGGLEPITASEVFLVEGRGFDRVTGVIIQEQFSETKKNLDKLVEAKKFFNILNKSLADKALDNEINQKIYKGVLYYLKCLEDEEIIEVSNFQIKLAILWKLIYWLGYQPGIFRCFNCGKLLTEEEECSFFIPYGVSCSCFDKGNHAGYPTQEGQNFQKTVISKSALNFLKSSLINSTKTVSDISLSVKSSKEVEKIIKLTLEYNLEKRIDI